MTEMATGFAIIDRPLVSALLEDTLAELQVPVLKNHPGVVLRREADLNLLSPDEFFHRLRASSRPRLYTNSEDSLSTVLELMAGSELARQIGDAKNKRLMRDILTPLYPDFWYRSASPAELRDFDPHSLPYPLIIKPAVGFLSVGVESVESPAQWAAALDRVQHQLDNARDAFPPSVLRADEVLVEQRVPGEEFALDVYFDGAGTPVLVDVMAHLLRGPDDVEDKVYLTGRDVVERRAPLFLPLLSRMGEELRLRDLPAHIEFRMDGGGRPIPIEINPLRFAGFCTTDLAWHAYGLNPHRAFLQDEAPDWPVLLQKAGDHVFSVIILGLPKTLDRSLIRDVRWGALGAVFPNLKELRRVDFHTYPLLGFAFIESSSPEEPHRVLGLDLLQFVQFA